ncbi:MAG: hypothetical protein C4589_11835 [Peptococcaceae bacterium]|nr:MAG: hypothetical protein C4589_11835 [Peptococcaceae bacterium]
MTSKNNLVKLLICLIVTMLLAGRGTVEAAGPAGGEKVATRGVTANTIKIGMMPDLSGPYRAAGLEARKGVEAWVKHINDQGGIHGRKIQVIVEDNGGNPSTTIAAANKLIFNDQVFAILGVHGASAFEAIFDLVEKEKVPTFSLGYSTSNFKPFKKMIFVIGTPYYYQAARAVTYIVEDLKISKPKLAVLYQDDAFGRDFLHGVRDEAKAHGITILKEEPYVRGAREVNSQVASLKRAGAEQVILGAIYVHAALFVREAARIGDFNPLVIGPNPTVGDVFFDIAKEAGKGYKAADCFGKPGEKEIAEVEAITKKYENILPLEFVLMGITNAQVFTAGLEKAGKNLTLDNFIKAMESLKDVDMKGTMPNVSLSAVKHHSTTESVIYEADPATRTWKKVSPLKNPKIAR